MRSKTSEALNKDVDRMIVYGSHARPIVFETNLKTGVVETFEQRFATPTDYVSPTKYNPDNPPLMPEVPITYNKAIEALGLRTQSASLHEITPSVQRLTLVQGQRAS